MNHRPFVLASLLAAAMTIGACHHRQNVGPGDPRPHPKGEVDDEQTRLIYLHGRRDVQAAAQHIATLSLIGGNRKLLTDSLGDLDAAQKAFDSDDPKAVAEAIMRAAQEAMDALKTGVNPEDRDREIACLQSLKDAVQACNRDMLCIAKALLAYINCIHGYQGPLTPVNPSNNPPGTQPAGGIR